MTHRAVGVVGDDALADRLADQGFDVVTDLDAATDHVVAVGERALTAVARADVDPLVVPVDAGRGVRSVPRSALPGALDGLPEADVERHTVLDVRCDGQQVGRALWDVTLVTEDAARISEYAVGTPTDTIDPFRADGVVVATAAGSAGYARRVGGPVLAPADVAVVTPIAPFATDPDHWVVGLQAVTLTVERDDATVVLLCDDERARTVAPGEPVTLSPDGALRVALVEESRPRFT